MKRSKLSSDPDADKNVTLRGKSMRKLKNRRQKKVESKSKSKSSKEHLGAPMLLSVVGTQNCYDVSPIY